MKWLATTVALLMASASLAGWIYLRDRDTSGWRPPERQTARVDAVRLFSALAGTDCHRGCGVELLGRPHPGRWLTRITINSRTDCFQIDLAMFSMTQQRGAAGVQQIGCGARS